MGEVIHTGTDVFGEGVNIAARIEPKADPDGIAVSDVIANAARNKVPAHFMSMGRLPNEYGKIADEKHRHSPRAL